ncbi:MAG: deoxyribose-phosphate aldolase [Lentisphaerae bacterium]|jgi:deoxyribose-phosphate aldolase|nr:deoxyribose-phosphate aldolase [Lentisphaerota bacterium]
MDEKNKIAHLIDHALLQPNLSDPALEAGCRAAAGWGVASVCILPHAVARCAELLAGSDVAASTVIGFPHGAHMSVVKAAEARRALDDGAIELDMVINISKAVSGAWRDVHDDIRAVLAEVREAGAKLKVIFENCYLDNNQKIRLCEMCSEIGVDWVKTSTGFGTGGATAEDVILMRQRTAPSIQIKASGGIRDLESVRLFRDLGCSRIGCSRTAEILAACNGLNS